MVRRLLLLGLLCGLASGCRGSAPAEPPPAAEAEATPAPDLSTWYFDYDGDGWGRYDDSELAVEAPVGHVARVGDCNDHDAGVNPDVEEYDNGIDDDCDCRVDEVASDMAGVEVVYGERFTLAVDQIGVLPDGTMMLLRSSDPPRAEVLVLDPEPRTECRQREVLVRARRPYGRHGAHLVQLLRQHGSQRADLRITKTSEATDLPPMEYGTPVKMPVDGAVAGPDGLVVDVQEAETGDMGRLEAELRLQRDGRTEVVRLSFYHHRSPVDHSWYRDVVLTDGYRVWPAGYRLDPATGRPEMEFTVHSRFVGTFEIGEPFGLEDHQSAVVGDLRIAIEDRRFTLEEPVEGTVADDVAPDVFVVLTWDGQHERIDITAEGDRIWRDFVISLTCCTGSKLGVVVSQRPGA
jgi:hypothetical protein